MRYFCFYLNKGAERVYLYNALGKNKGYGIVQANFAEYAAQGNKNYPLLEKKYVSPVLLTTNRIVEQMKDGLEPNLTKIRQLEVVSIKDDHNNFQFKGDGSKKHPNLYNREVFTFLPYQVSDRKFVIPYYVMTRDLKENLDAEEYQLTVKGFNSPNLNLKVYDPLEDEYLPNVSFKQSGNKLKVNLETKDYPRLLIVEEEENN